MRLAAALAAVAAALAAAPAVASAPKPRKVAIADNYYAPAKLTVKPGTKVSWRWPEVAGDVHDVKLESGPKAVKRFRSEPASSAFSYSRTLRATGRYRIVCTLHEDMTMTVTVRR